MAGTHPEERVTVPIIQQSWRHVTFLHWRIDPDEIARLLPDGLEPELIDGSAWLGLTPFRVERFRALWLPPVPILSSFPETNLRTYVRHDDGRDGLWFLSLDVPSAANVVAGRIIAAPYHRSSMSISVNGHVRYRCRRQHGPPAHHDIELVPGDPIEAGPGVALLTGRWRAFTEVAGRLLEVAVQHEPWPLRSAQLLRLDQDLIEAAGLTPPSGEPIVHYSEGVNARLGRPRDAPRRI